MYSGRRRRQGFTPINEEQSLRFKYATCGISAVTQNNNIQGGKTKKPRFGQMRNPLNPGRFTPVPKEGERAAVCSSLSPQPVLLPSPRPEKWSTRRCYDLGHPILLYDIGCPESKQCLVLQLRLSRQFTWWHWMPGSKQCLVLKFPGHGEQQCNTAAAAPPTVLLVAALLITMNIKVSH